ncbi:MAG: protease inhibitor I42 family protein [Candidatus Brocadiales bacterium]
MKSLCLIMPVIIPLLTSTIACTGETKVSEGLLPPPETIIRQADGGKIFKLRKGDEIVIHLKGNRTTGYSWAIEEVDDNVLGLVNDVYIPDKPVMIGSGGVRTITFKAVLMGASPVRLKYWRPWEGESSVVERFEVTVQVGE